MIPTFRKRYVVLTTVAILLFILFRTHEFDDHSTKKKESALEHELKSLIPYSPNWAQKQFQHTLTLMGKEYSKVKMWSKCDHFTAYYENIKVIFTKIPKGGSSNWQEALLKANGDITMNLTFLESKKIVRNLKYHDIPNAKKLYSDVDFRDAFSFTSVRNPWTRMVSGYLHFFNGSFEPRKGVKMQMNMEIMRMQIVEEIRGITDKEKLQKLIPSFEEFVKWLIKHNGTKDRHLKPQVKILCIPRARYDYIVPLEYSTLVSDEVWHLIGANTKFRGSYDGTTDPRVQSSAVNARKMLSDLDKDIIDKLYEIYRMDFSLMNYSNFTHQDFPLPLFEP